MEDIFKIFNIDEEKILSFKKSVTERVNNFLSSSNTYKGYHLYLLDREINEYLEFGADKCSVDNFDEFCEELNIDVKKNLLRIIQEQRLHIEDIRSDKISKYEHIPTYVFYSRDEKITFTCSRPGEYMHYFGITGESNKIIEAFTIFKKRCEYEDACFGGRDFI